MHISLDSALGRQKRLNQVGETISSIAVPTAGYSLRSLTGGDPKVVRVRRASDNDEQDFTASEVASGAMLNYVNTQAIKPLDIRLLTDGTDDDGRNGNFIIAKAAYSLRSLGTRQATVTSSGDTDGDTSGKFVCQVRRSSDDKLKSFTADEITDGTLLSFVGTTGDDDGHITIWYDQSVSDQAGNTATGNHATQSTPANQPKIIDAGILLNELDFDGINDHLDLTSPLGITSAGAIFTVAESGGGNDKIILDNRDGGTDGFRLFRFGDALEYRWQSATVDTLTNPGTDTKFIGFANHDGSDASAAVNGATATTVSDTSSVSVTSTPRIGARSFTSATNFWDGTINELIIYDTDQNANRTAIEANMSEAYGINLPAGIDPFNDEVDGFVHTWYDQFGSNDVVQSTSTRQPKIVDEGSARKDANDNFYLQFDGTDDFYNINKTTFRNVSYGYASAVAQLNDTTTVNEPVYYASVGTSGTKSRALLGKISSGGAKIAAGARRLDNGGFASSLETANTDKNLLTALFQWGDGEVQLFVNGTAKTAGSFTSGSGNTSDTDSNSAFIGRLGSSYYDGKIYELILYNTDQSGNRQALETNMANEYNITL